MLIAGNADVYEANVSLRVLDETGAELARTFTTATCGTGCRGDYSIEVPFMVTHAQVGMIEVWWDSAEDGSRQDIVQVPVILEP